MVRTLVNLLLVFPLVLFGCFSGDSADRTASLDDYTKIDQQPTSLDEKSDKFIQNYGDFVKKYSEKYGIDWRLTLAVVKVESRFHANAESHMGAAGLMQIMPVTQAQLATELGYDEAAFDRPHVNIHGGIYYINKLYKIFGEQNLTEENRIRFTLAAYNAGLGRILDAQKIAFYMKDDPKEWSSVKNSLSLLSKQYSSIHRRIWEERKPSNGYFRQWKQTTRYVEEVIGEYNSYCRLLPTS
jgi:membrane-bound lytic murein transglycosylase F